MGNFVCKLLGIAFFHFIVYSREWMRREGEESNRVPNLNGRKKECPEMGGPEGSM
jgi:hypothetical protein